MTTQEHRELDAHIAEHVMGWTVKSRPCAHSGSVTEHFWFEPGNDIEPKYRSSTKCMFPSGATVGNRWPELDIPHYSTNADWGLEVLKKCIATNSAKSVCVCRCKGGFQVYHGGSHYFKSQVTAETLELAICLFAKKLFTKGAV